VPRLLETLIGLATGFFVGGVVGLGVVGEIDSTGSHPSRNAAVVLLLGSAGALLAALAFLPRPAPPRARVAELPIGDVLANPLVDPAVHLDPDRVRAYVLALNAAPPVVVFDTGDGLVLADGYHRVAAARYRGATTIKAEIRVGTREDALHYAAATVAREQGMPIEDALATIERQLVDAAGQVRRSHTPGMATRADFTDDEWKAMQEGISGAGTYVALVDRGFFDNFKEANALARHLRDAHEHSDSVLVRDLAAGHDRPFGVTSSPQEIEQGTVSALEKAVAALEAKSPEDLPAYRQVVLDVAQSVAEAAKGVSDQENQALDRIRAALGTSG
jgi:hypothetical protein